MVTTKPTSRVRICYVLTCFRLFSQLRKRFPFPLLIPFVHLYTLSIYLYFCLWIPSCSGQTVRTLFPSTLFRFSNKINEEKSIQQYGTRSKLYNVYSVIFFFNFLPFFLFCFFLFYLSISLNLSLSLFSFFRFYSPQSLVVHCPLAVLF